MTMKIRLNVIVAAAALVVVQAEARVKIIGLGWDTASATPEQILAKAEDFKATGLDGIAMAIPHRKVHASDENYRTIMTDAPWKKADWKKTVGVLRGITAKPWLRESFILALLAPRTRLRWDDDAAWSRFEENVGVLAWMAKEGGLKGLFVDHEDYTRARQYTRLPEDTLSYKDLAHLARTRGAQTCAAIYREFPDAVLIATWFFSEHPNYLVPNGDAVQNAMQAGDLWPWFLNGFIDAMPMTGRFVDGCENAYTHKAQNDDFYRSYVMIKRDALALVAPENRWKYSALASVGFGLFPDSYLKAEDRQPDANTMLPVNGSLASAFAANLAQAVRVADDYVWIYGERANFVDWRGAGSMKFEGWLEMTELPAWNEKVPGFNEIVAYTKDPLAYVDERFGRDTAAENLVKNGACTSMDGYGTYISFWLKDKDRDGTFAVDKTVGCGDTSSLCAETVKSGCFTVTVSDVKEGEVYAFTAEALGRAPSVSMYWLKDGKGVFSIPEERGQVKEGDAKEWRRIRALWTVPAGVDSMGIRLETNLECGEKIHYDNVGVYKAK